MNVSALSGQLHGIYDPRLVALSVIIAIGASYAALDLVGRVTAARGSARITWLACGSVAMGTGIWSMHYIGMLALSLPIEVRYDWPTVLASLAAAICASAVALFVASRPHFGARAMVWGGVLMGAGITSMHYIGMEAMRLPAMHRYSPGLVLLSVLLAVVISMAALSLAFRLRGEKRSGGWRKFGSAVLMGAAVPLMHYVGMAAVTFVPMQGIPDFSHSLTISSLGVAGILGVTAIILGVAIATSFIDRRFSAHNVALDRSEQRFRQLVEAAQVVLWRAEVDSTHCNFVNREAEALLDYPVDRWLTDPAFWLDHLDPHDRAPAVSACAAALASGEAQRFEHRMPTADGRQLWFGTSVCVVPSTNGSAELVGVMTDITGRKRAQETAEEANRELAQAKSKLEGFLTASPDAMLVIDEVGNIVLASQRVETIFGYMPDETVGQPFDLLMPERFRGTYAQHVGDFAHAPRVREMGVGLELYALRKDGSEFPTEISLSPHQTPAGLVVIAAIRDITVRKQADVALQQAQKMEAVGQLTSGVAHDFNNVLGAVIGNLDLLAEVIGDNPKAVRYTEQALAATLSGAELVKRLLAFSRRQPLHLNSLDLHETMASVTPLVRRTISERIAIVENIADDLWLALADPSQIENAVLNLAINARDAMSEGGTLTIDCRNVTVDEDYAPAYGADFRPGDYVVISVTDTGHGMAPEVAARAFDPFFTTKGQGVGTGTGLGLSMVLGTMKQSGGSAQIYSEPEHGTTVRLLLPRTVNSKKSDNGRAIGGETLARGNERVLVVEDDERIREVSYTMLTSLGYQVETAESADEALARISGGERFDLVFSDVVMPGTHTGITLAVELRRIDPRLKIILTSGYASLSNFPDGFEQLGIELISKPFRKVDLSALIRRVLNDQAR